LRELARQRGALLERTECRPERGLHVAVLGGQEALEAVDVSDAAPVDRPAVLLVLPDPAVAIRARQARRASRLRLVARAAVDLDEPVEIDRGASDEPQPGRSAEHTYELQ